MDSYYKKTIDYNINNRKYTFDVAHGLFSTYNVDVGTDLLLDSLIRRFPLKTPPKKILDIGCGYGPLGIVLASNWTASEVEMVDKDLLAIKYSEINCDKNGVLDRANVYGSLATENVVGKEFDLIVSNIPAKIGDLAIKEEFIQAPVKLLAKGGSYYFVVVSGLNRLIPKIGNDLGIRIEFLSKRVGHSVYKIDAF